MVTGNYSMPKKYHFFIITEKGLMFRKELEKFLAVVESVGPQI